MDMLQVGKHDGKKGSTLPLKWNSTTRAAFEELKRVLTKELELFYERSRQTVCVAGRCQRQGSGGSIGTADRRQVESRRILQPKIGQVSAELDTEGKGNICRGKRVNEVGRMDRFAADFDHDRSQIAEGLGEGKYRHPFRAGRKKGEVARNVVKIRSDLCLCTRERQCGRRRAVEVRIPRPQRLPGHQLPRKLAGPGRNGRDNPTRIGRGQMRGPNQ